MKPYPRKARLSEPMLVKALLDSIMKTLAKRSPQSGMMGYQKILESCLPPIWRHRALLMDTKGGKWTIHVATPQDAFQFRYFASEIETKLAERLPHPPKLKVQANPVLWRHYPERHKPIMIKKARQYSMEEANAVIARFLEDKR